MSELTFTGVSAFPLTPFRDREIDQQSFVTLLERLEQSQVDSIAVLGSTGSYMYLSPAERERAVVLAAETVQSKPLIVGVGDVATLQVLEHIKVAEQVRASAVLVAPVSYQPLTAHEVFNHFATICENTELPVIVYDNPATTHFTFDIELYAHLSELPGIKSIKIPPGFVAGENPSAAITALKAEISDDVSIGISGDGAAARGLVAGCNLWYSAIAGTLPHLAEEIYGAARSQRPEIAVQVSSKYQPLWDLFAECGGSARAIAAIAELKGLVHSPCLPEPLLSLPNYLQKRVDKVLKELKL